MIDLQGYMLKLAEADNGSTHNQVFVYRKVLTEVYLRGHEDGLRAATQDDFVRHSIEQVSEKAETDHA